MYVCMHACMYVNMYVCNVFIACTSVRMYVRTCVMHVCDVCMYVCMHACMYIICIYVCMHVCMYAGMYACI